MAAKNINTRSLQWELFGGTGAGEAEAENVSQGRIGKVRGVGDPLGTGLCSHSPCWEPSTLSGAGGAAQRGPASTRDTL